MKSRLSILGSAALLATTAFVVIPDDLEDAFRSLKEAETLKDPALIKQMAVRTCAMARALIAAPVRESEADNETIAQQFERAHTIELYTEYALYVAALQGPPATTVDLIATLERQNPASQYLDQAYPRYFLALHQTGAAAKIPAIAEAAIVHFPDHEDLLAVLADSALANKQQDRALGYAERLIAVLAKHPKPEQMSAADWQRKRAQQLGRAHWIAGILRCEKNDYVQGDKDLRLAIPLIKDSQVMRASALFYLGLANYQLGAAAQNKARVLEAIQFSEQAAAIESDYAMQAWRNVQAMKRYAQQMR
ncbi:MAG: hypothetical protein KIT09_27320 [Bryobacteraceae bacterium]|nr:hypothetical protein [Bryobacteraceae bacterium]